MLRSGSDPLCSGPEWTRPGSAGSAPSPGQSTDPAGHGAGPGLGRGGPAGRRVLGRGGLAIRWRWRWARRSCWSTQRRSAPSPDHPGKVGPKPGRPACRSKCFLEQEIQNSQSEQQLLQRYHVDSCLSEFQVFGLDPDPCSVKVLSGPSQMWPNKYLWTLDLKELDLRGVTDLPSIQDLYWMKMETNVSADPTHAGHERFRLLLQRQLLKYYFINQISCHLYWTKLHHVKRKW